MTATREMNTDPIKVLAISHACVSPVNRHVYRHLQSRGLAIEIVVPQKLYKDEKRIVAAPAQPEDPPLHFEPMYGSNGRLFWYPRLQAVLDRVRPDVVFAEADTASLITIAAGWWCRRNGARLICRTAENLSWRGDDTVRRVGWNELPRAIAKTSINGLVRGNVEAVCTTSLESAALFRRHGYRNVQFVPMGTNRALFRYSSRIRNATRATLGIGADEIVVSYFGRTIPEKGVDTLITAMGALKHLPWRLLVNKFEDQTAYVAQIERMLQEIGIGDRVVWARSQHGEIARLMMASDVAVVPSRTTPKWVEQYGRVVPEAMSCGNVPIVSDSGAPKELVGEAGYVFPEGDHAALSRLLAGLMADPGECLRRRKLAMRRSDRYYSIAVEAAMYERLFRTGHVDR